MALLGGRRSDDGHVPKGVLEIQLRNAETQIAMLKSMLQIANQQAEEARGREKVHVTLLKALCHELVEDAARDQYLNGALAKPTVEACVEYLKQGVKRQISELRDQVRQAQAEAARLAAEIAKMRRDQGVSAEGRAAQASDPGPGSEAAGAPREEAVARALEGSQGAGRAKPEGAARDAEAEALLARLGEAERIMLRLIGKFGIARAVELQAAPDLAGLNEMAFRSALRTLMSTRALLWQDVDPGGKGRRFLAFHLSPAGTGAYRVLTGEEPVQSLHEQLTGWHGSPEHGWLCYNVAVQMRQLSWDVSIDPKDNLVNTAAGPISFDLVARRGNAIRYIECERGTHNGEDFNHKMNRFYALTRDLFFVAPSRNVVQRLKSMVSEWVLAKGGRNAVGELRVHFASVDDSKDDRWETMSFGAGGGGQA